MDYYGKKTGLGQTAIPVSASSGVTYELSTHASLCDILERIEL